MKPFYSLLICFFCFTSCDQIQSLSDQLFKTPTRIIYARSLDDSDIEVLKWKTEYDQAKQSQLNIEDSFVSKVYFSDKQQALSYIIELEEGERFTTSIDSPMGKNYFIEFYKMTNGENSETFFFSSMNETEFSIIIQESGLFRVLIQPEINVVEQATLKIYTEPTIAFPVADATNKSIQSFWGAPRDGGARKHEGVDIFAPKGTSLLSAVDGRVYRVGDHGLGGKQVWIKDKESGHSLYYAHLDRILASKGQKVRTGDIIGTVGNTGNARTTPPHLHFGIYQNGQAIDPYPFIKIRDIPELKGDLLSSNRIKTNKKINLRISPSLDAEVIKELSLNAELTLIGQSNNWLQVLTKDEEEGFVYKNLIK